MLKAVMLQYCSDITARWWYGPWSMLLSEKFFLNRFTTNFVPIILTPTEVTERLHLVALVHAFFFFSAFIPVYARVSK